MKNPSPWVFLLASVVFLGGCATYTDQTAEMRSAFRAHHFPESIEKLKKAGIEAEGRSRLLYGMEKGMILDRMGNRSESRKTFLQADRVVDELYTVSIANTAATFLVNESMSDYAGEDYEVVALHTMLALSYLEDKLYDDAHVEAKKINNRLHTISAERGDDHNGYKEDAFARYLSGMIFEAQGEWDDAFIDYRQALALFEQKEYKKFYFGGAPKSLVEALSSLAIRRNRPEIFSSLQTRYPKWVVASPPPETGEVAVIHESGVISVKKAKEFVLPLGGQIIRFSFPYIDERSVYPSYNTGVEFQGRFIQGDNVADMNALAHYSLEERRLRLIAKSAARLIAKAALTEQAYKNFGPLGGIAANVYSVVSETADTRGWTLLPEAFYVTRLRLPVGKQTIQVKNEGRINQMLVVDVKKNQLQVFRDYVH